MAISVVRLIILVPPRGTPQAFQVFNDHLLQVRVTLPLLEEDEGCVDVGAQSQHEHTCLIEGPALQFLVLDVIIL